MILRYDMRRRATTDIMYNFGMIADISQIIFFSFFNIKSYTNLKKEENSKGRAIYLYMGLSNNPSKIVR